jgi:hypothetical protein
VPVDIGVNGPVSPGETGPARVTLPGVCR